MVGQSLLHTEESPCFVAERWCISTPLLKAGHDSCWTVLMSNCGHPWFLFVGRAFDFSHKVFCKQRVSFWHETPAKSVSLSSLGAAADVFQGSCMMGRCVLASSSCTSGTCSLPAVCIFQVLLLLEVHFWHGQDSS